MILAGHSFSQKKKRSSTDLKLKNTCCLLFELGPWQFLTSHPNYFAFGIKS